jgi:phosphoserine phosphatase RsbU/P
MTLLTKKSTEVQLKQLQLNSLLQITEAINQNFTKSQLLSIYEFVLRNQLKVDKLFLITYDNSWDISLIYGVSPEFSTTRLLELVTSNTGGLKSLTDFNISEFEEVIPVFHKSKALAYAFIGKVGKSDVSYREDILPFIQTITNLVIVALENKKLAKDFVKQAGIKKELALAAQMQAMLFPEKLPHFDNVDMSALYLPHAEVGGDYYDFIRVNEHEFITCMADVSGKGVPAALLMSNFQATLHALAKHCKSLTELVEQLNDSVIRSAKGEKFITLFICKFNTETREFQYINAGHNPPILLSDGKVRLLEEGSIGLGMFEKLPFISQGGMIAKLGAEYLLVCYTDGIIELSDEEGNLFGMERLEKFVIENSAIGSMGAFQKKLMIFLNEFRGNRPFVDDVTLLVCRCKF